MYTKSTSSTQSEEPGLVAWEERQTYPFSRVGQPMSMSRSVLRVALGMGNKHIRTYVPTLKCAIQKLDSCDRYETNAWTDL